MTLLRAVSVTDRATSPFASFENTLEELPPGQQAHKELMKACKVYQEIAQSQLSAKELETA